MTTAAAKTFREIMNWLAGRRSKAMPGRVYGPLTDAERCTYENIMSQDTRGW